MSKKRNIVDLMNMFARMEGSPELSKPGNKKLFRPELLTCPHTPKPFHNMTPKMLLGEEWWQEQRRKGFYKTNHRCHACGVHKKEAKVHQWLEGHPHLEIDYRKQICKITEIVMLCYSCHNFIHSGRLYQFHMEGKATREEIFAIFQHGLTILKENKLKVFEFTLLCAQNLCIPTFGLEKIESSSIYYDEFGSDWSKWRMILEGKEYKPRFNSEKEWHNFYNVYRNGILLQDRLDQPDYSYEFD